jgi:hypothetical protein
VSFGFGWGEEVGVGVGHCGVIWVVSWKGEDGLVCSGDGAEGGN